MRTTLGILVALMLGGAAAPALAHHSFATEYDGSKIISLQGVVTKVEWTNPHAFIYLEVTDEKGQKSEWAIEMMSLNHLKGYGWSRNTVQPGETISCTGGAARSGAPAMLSSIVKLGDGRVIKS